MIKSEGNISHLTLCGAMNELIIDLQVLLLELSSGRVEVEDGIDGTQEVISNLLHRFHKLQILFGELGLSQRRG